MGIILRSRLRGSSPLARGLPDGDHSAVTVEGIIPARAGFTGCATTCARRRRDHPRSRGVYGGSMAVTRPPTGSSPLARGLPEGRAPCGGPARIIPARAGFTHADHRVIERLSDHPRSRGVYDLPTHRDLLDPRIIPARAGFTPGRMLRLISVRDHPRSRGVYRGDDAISGPAEGSSPLARGLPHRLARRPAECGIIPARAGFTRLGTPSRAIIADHPRSRGVYPAKSKRYILLHGSSPLARGLPPLLARMVAPGGIIPARAGFTPGRGRG